MWSAERPRTASGSSRGTGHSFTATAATDGVLIRPDLLTGIRDIDRRAMTVTVEA